MFSYDPVLCTVVKTLPKSIGDAVRILQEIQAICVDGDGLKWFNWLYLKVTQAVEERVASGGFKDPAWLAELDVRFASLYFSALERALLRQRAPDCWRILFDCRGQTSVARIKNKAFKDKRLSISTNNILLCGRLVQADRNHSVLPLPQRELISPSFPRTPRKWNCCCSKTQVTLGPCRS